MSTRAILTQGEREVMLANALRALFTNPSDHNRAWAKAALERYDTDREYERYLRNWPDSEALEGRR